MASSLMEDVRMPRKQHTAEEIDAGEKSRRRADTETFKPRIK